MFPIRDHNPSGRTPYVTYVLMALNVAIFLSYAGLFNAGVMGFAALGGLAAVLVSMDPVPSAWAAGGGPPRRALHR